MWTKKQFSGGEPVTAMKTIAQGIGAEIRKLAEPAASLVPFLGNNASFSPIACKSMVAMALKKRPCLFQFDYSGAPEQASKELPFISLGSGQPIADPFLALLKRILWADREPTVAEGRFVAAWTIYHVERTIPGGVGGNIQVATLTDGPKIEFVSDQGEHEQAVAAAEAAIRDHILQGAPGPAPTIPKP